MSLRDRVKNILMQPRREWRVIAREPSSVAELYLSYVAPLAGIGPPASAWRRGHVRCFWRGAAGAGPRGGGETPCYGSGMTSDNTASRCATPVGRASGRSPGGSSLGAWDIGSLSPQTGLSDSWKW